MVRVCAVDVKLTILVDVQSVPELRFKEPAIDIDGDEPVLKLYAPAVTFKSKQVNAPV